MISKEEVRHVANLARLGLTDDEVEKMSGQLGAILESIDQIGELDLADVPPTANALNLTNVLRPDDPHARPPRPPTRASRRSRTTSAPSSPPPRSSPWSVPRGSTPKRRTVGYAYGRASR